MWVAEITFTLSFVTAIALPQNTNIYLPRVQFFNPSLVWDRSQAASIFTPCFFSYTIPCLSLFAQPPPERELTKKSSQKSGASFFRLPLFKKPFYRSCSRPFRIFKRHLRKSTHKRKRAYARRFFGQRRRVFLLFQPPSPPPHIYFFPTCMRTRRTSFVPKPRFLDGLFSLFEEGGGRKAAFGFLLLTFFEGQESLPSHPLSASLKPHPLFSQRRKGSRGATNPTS